MNLRRMQFDFQDNVKFNEYDMSVNEMVFDYGIVPNSVNISEVNKYVFGEDVDGQGLRVCGARKLAAISCDPCMDENKCNRLIVLDISVEDEDEEDDEDEGEQDEDQEEQIVDEEDDNEDSDFRNIVDID
mmetsp:Transcript_23154/g.36902  ORF Transcript_23154/g.36902 Transcript_23154/m.36902 type:complete len:130 (+) Transcript_23154:2-391(+)